MLSIYHKYWYWQIADYGENHICFPSCFDILYLFFRDLQELEKHRLFSDSSVPFCMQFHQGWKPSNLCFFNTITNHDIAIISYSFIYVLFIFGYVFIVYTSLHNNLMHVGKESLACHEGQNCQLRRSEFFVVIFYNVFVV